MKKGILLINLGSINICKKKVLVRFLREFLMDQRVISIPFWKRWLLVHCIILPFHARKSIKNYQKIWSENGSPLLFHSQELAKKVQSILGNDYVVELAMRYGNQSIEDGIEKLRLQNVTSLNIFPLFPQYASSTIGSIHEKVMQTLSKGNIIPNLIFQSGFHNRETYIDCMCSHIKKQHDFKSGYFMIFSYHSLPLSQINENQLIGFNGKTAYNYHQACIETSAAIAAKLKLNEHGYLTTFQSSMGNGNWLSPSTAETLKSLPGNEKKNVVICAPSFVADCLETVLEIDVDYRQLFLSSGGENFIFIESLNSNDAWASVIASMVS